MIQVDGIFVQQGGGGPVVPDFTYTGEYQLVNEDGGNWKIYFDTSGTFVSNVDMLVDAFCVGGGGGGGNGYFAKDFYGVCGGAGGGGGYTVTQKKVVIQSGLSYEITIGAGGGVGSSGGETSAFNLTAKGGYGGAIGDIDPVLGSNGGSAGGGCSSSGEAGGTNGGDTSANGQGVTTREFGEQSGILYSGGGGGGGGGSGKKRAGNGGAGGYVDESLGGGTGGTGGGVNGTSGFNGGSGGTAASYANAGGGGGGGGGRGGGGGGGGSNYWASSIGRGGAGAPGMVVIRNAREVAA